MNNLMNSRFIFYFVLTSRTIWIGLAQRISNTHFPLTPLYEWPIDDGWAEMKAFTVKNKWVTKEERYDILLNFTRVLDCWDSGDPKKIRYVENLKENFPESEYPNLVFFGRRLRKLFIY